MKTKFKLPKKKKTLRKEIDLISTECQEKQKKITNLRSLLEKKKTNLYELKKKLNQNIKLFGGMFLLLDDQDLGDPISQDETPFLGNVSRSEPDLKNKSLSPNNNSVSPKNNGLYPKKDPQQNHSKEDFWEEISPTNNNNKKKKNRRPKPHHLHNEDQTMYIFNFSYFNHFQIF
ncbi:hypothetical protein M0812_02154 [Anaeramoeba flamelloides]|uniref:Uncharacterized protein n=1 Tax=Anaeramoeba flamelloides TaxID=1746091 RepID=A0AAV7Z5T9_9EUKA|nr:hypothetical protein M0812_02154 [Anaeramoeba flamelloides]